MEYKRSYIHFLSSSPLFWKNRNAAAFFFFSSTGALGKGFEAGDIEESFVEVRRIGGAGGLSSSDILVWKLIWPLRSPPVVKKFLFYQMTLKIPALRTCVPQKFIASLFNRRGCRGRFPLQGAHIQSPSHTLRGRHWELHDSHYPIRSRAWPPAFPKIFRIFADISKVFHHSPSKNSCLEETKGEL